MPLKHLRSLPYIPNATSTWTGYQRFIAYCFEKGLATRTVKTYSAGINYWQQVQGHKSFSEEFRLSKVIECYSRSMGINQNRRRPITSEILFNVLQQLPNVCYNSYEATLFAAIFSLAYFGLFRISELVSPKGPEMYNQIRTSDVELSLGQSYISIRIAK